MSEHEQSTLIKVGDYEVFLNLSMYESDYQSPFYGPVKKGTWTFMTTYPKKNQTPSLRVRAAFDGVTVFFYGSQATAKAAVAELVRRLEATWDGWKEGYGGMGAAYIGKRRE